MIHLVTARRTFQDAGFAHVGEFLPRSLAEELATHLSAAPESEPLRRIEHPSTDCSCPVCVVRDRLASHDILELLSDLIGADLSRVAAVFASRYAAGDHHPPHADEGAGLVAFELNVTRNWRPEYGGALVILERGAGGSDYVTKTVRLPLFNDLTLFDVRGVGMPHLVGQIATFAPEKRIAISGWFA